MRLGGQLRLQGPNKYQASLLMDCQALKMQKTRHRQSVSGGFGFLSQLRLLRKVAWPLIGGAFSELAPGGSLEAEG